MNPSPQIVQSVWNLSGAQAVGRPPSPRGPHVVTWIYMPHLGVCFAFSVEPMK